MAMLALSASAKLLSHSCISHQYRKSPGDTRLGHPTIILSSPWTRMVSSTRSSVAASARRHQHDRVDEQQASGGDAGPSSSLDAGAAGVRTSRRSAERTTYLFAALASSCGITTLAAAAVYYRFVWQMQGSGEVPAMEMFGTFLLAFGAAVGMEFWARWAHRALWHASLWGMHRSHHRPREGPFELNDVFAIINAVPAIALMSYGFFHKGLVPGLCFGAGLGITVFGMAYMFVHDGLVHRRFPVGPIADVPYFQKVAAAHQLHHADLFQGVPYGLFLGPKELEQVGGSSELERLMKARQKSRSTSTT